MSALRRVDPLYLLALVLFVATVAVSAAFAGQGDRTGLARSASIYDEGPGGTAVLRRWLDSLGARTRVLQGERFATADSDAVLFVLGATEAITPADVTEMRRFVRRGGTLVLATEAGFAESLLLQPYQLGLTSGAQGQAEVIGTMAAGSGARSLLLDVGRTVSLGSRGRAIARTPRGPVAGYVPDQGGRLILVGSLAPFVSGHIGEGDNGRFVLGLAAAAMRGASTVAFDEYHHGAHPAPDVLAILLRTWPGRTLLVAGALVLAYVVLTGRRLGPALPLEHRPSRSSLEHVRAFAGLVRRSGRGEIARDRLRRDLRMRLARIAGMDPAAPLERILGTLAGESPRRAAEAREIDAVLARPLRDADLLRTVRRIDALDREDAS